MLILIIALIISICYTIHYRKLSIYDPLTGLYNRREFEKKLVKSMKIKKTIYYYLLDLDNFKEINDTFGHQEGDRVLKITAKTINSFVKKYGGVVGRYGGEEFCIFIEDPGINPKTIGQLLCLKIKNKIGITISIGATYYGGDMPINVENLIRRADNALYIAKSSGKNKTIVKGVKKCY